MNILKIFSDLAFVVQALRLFHSFTQSEKKRFLKGMVLDENGLSSDNTADRRGYKYE